MVRSPSICKPHRRRRRSCPTGCPFPGGHSTCCCGSTAPRATPVPERSTCRPRSSPEAEVTASGAEVSHSVAGAPHLHAPDGLFLMRLFRTGRLGGEQVLAGAVVG